MYKLIFFMRYTISLNYNAIIISGPQGPITYIFSWRSLGNKLPVPPERMGAVSPTLKE